VVLSEVRYREIPEVWATLKTEMADCEACGRERYELLEGTATRYEFCEPHRQRLHREWALAHDAGREEPADTRAPESLREAWPEGGPSSDLREGIEHAARTDPEAALVLRDRLVEHVESAAPGQAWSSALGDLAGALGQLARVDQASFDRLCYWFATGEPPDERDPSRWPDALPGATVPEGVLSRYGLAGLEALARTAPGRFDDRLASALCDRLAARPESVFEDPLGLLLGLVRARPGLVARHLDPATLAAVMDDADEYTAFAALVLFGHAARADASVIDGHREALWTVYETRGDPLRGGAAAALYLAGELDASECRDALETLFDPTRYGHRYLREAAVVLGEVGTAATAELLEYRAVPYPSEELTDAIDEAITALRAGPEED
jgi:hypothetical protein